jgi:hypothetical protein
LSYLQDGALGGVTDRLVNDPDSERPGNAQYVRWDTVQLQGDRIVFEFKDGTWTDFSAFEMVRWMNRSAFAWPQGYLDEDDVRRIVREEFERSS